MRPRTALLAFVLLAVAVASPAVDLVYVDPTASPCGTPPCGSQSCPCDTLQSAIQAAYNSTAAINGGVITISCAPGTYSGPANAALQLPATSSPIHIIAQQGAGSTVLQVPSNASEPLITFGTGRSGMPFQLQGFTIACDGHPAQYTVISAVNASVALSDITMANADLRMPFLDVLGSNVTLQQATFTKLVIQNLPGLISSMDSTVHLNQVHYDTLLVSTLLTSNHSDLRVENCTITNCTSIDSLFDVGIPLGVRSALEERLLMSNTTLLDNYVGGSIITADAADIQLAGVVLRDLIVNAVMISGRLCSFQMTDCVVERVDLRASGVLLQGYLEEEKELRSAPELAASFTNVSFQGNWVSDGALLEFQDISVILHQCEWASTQLSAFHDASYRFRMLQYSTSLLTYAFTLLVEDCTMAQNNKMGAVETSSLVRISVQPGDTVSFTQCHFVNNTGDGTLLEFLSAGPEPLLMNAIEAYNNTGAVVVQANFQLTHSAFINGHGRALNIMGQATLHDVLVEGYVLESLEYSLIQVGAPTDSPGTVRPTLNIVNSVLRWNSVAAGVINAANAQLTLQGCLLHDNNSSFVTGGISAFHSNMVVDNCTVWNNEAPLGGIFSATEANFTLTNSNITDNAGIFGGAAFTDALSHFVAKDCLVQTNQAADRGGGFYIQGSGQLTRVHFISNQADHGGAIDFGGSSTVAIEDCYFSGNFAGAGGAIAMSSKAKPSVTNSVFEANTALSAGGVLRLSGFSQPTFLNCSFMDNTASSVGGVGSLTDFAAASFTECQMASNWSPNEAGAIHCMDESQLDLTDCLLELNHAGASGGALAFGVKSKGNIRGTSIRRNSAASKGGGIACLNKCSPNFTDVSLVENEAGSGAGLWITDSARPTLLRTIFRGNRAASQAGGLLSSDAAGGVLEDCTFEGNQAPAGAGGGMVAQDSSDTHLYRCEFYGNVAQNGGGIFSVANEGPTSVNCTFQQNVAYINGGGLFLGEQCSANMTSLKCRDNISYGNGGCLALSDAANPTFHGLNATTNTALAFGGGLMIADRASPIISASVLIANSALSGGGFAFEQTSTGSIKNSIITLNNASALGGGALLQGAGITMLNTAFILNTATSFGGGLCIDGNTESFINHTICDGCDFLSNRALRGGAISIELSGNNVLPPVQSGSAPWVDFTELSSHSFVNCQLIQNYATSGAGIYYAPTYLPSVTFTAAVVGQNVASDFGGGVYVATVGTEDASDDAWMFASNFTENHGLYAGYNAAFRTVSSSHDPKRFCEGCAYPTPSYIAPLGYSDPDGFATAPISATFITGCPSSLPLIQSPFDIQLQLFDSFGTLVNGTLLDRNTYNVTVASWHADCLLASGGDSLTQHFLTHTGMATFQGLVLGAKNGTMCSLSFNVQSAPIISTMSPVSCVVEMTGCPTNYKLVHADPYDYCQYAPQLLTQTQVLLLIIIGLLLVLLCFVVVSLALYALSVRRKQLKYRLRYQQIPDFADGRPTVSLESILADPSISRIPHSQVEIGERLGVGASGIVCQALWRRPGKPPLAVAMKELLMSLTDLHDDALQEFLVEIKLMSALKHNHIVQFLGVVVVADENKLYLVTELMHHGNLRDVLDRKRNNLPWRLRLKLAKDAAKGMAYLHSRHLIHRDLKPQNLLVNENMCCKVSDFGISTVSHHTTHRTCIGTPIYMAPEVLAKDKYSEKADVFSFGVLLVEIYTGHRPYASGEYSNLNQAQLMFQIIQNGARPEMESLPVALQQLVVDCWAEDICMRPTFPEIVVRLRRLVHLKVPMEEDLVELSDSVGALSSSEVLTDSLLGSQQPGFFDTRSLTSTQSSIN